MANPGRGFGEDFEKILSRYREDIEKKYENKVKNRYKKDRYR